MKALVGAFNQEKALVGAFVISVIMTPSFEALICWPWPGLGNYKTLASTGGRPKGAGRALALPRKNNSACRNENRAIVGTGMKILSEQKLEVCWNHQKFINCQTSLELQGGRLRFVMILGSPLKIELKLYIWSGSDCSRLRIAGEIRYLDTLKLGYI